jgi:hypothetical protein
MAAKRPAPHAPDPASVAADPAGWLREVLGGLVEATDAITATVTGRDLEGLTAAVGRAEALTNAMSRAQGTLDDLRGDPRIRAAAPEIIALRERIRENGRRNAHLIQRAWELDAAAVRLLVRLVAPDGDPAAIAYASGPTPRLLDTPA